MSINLFKSKSAGSVMQMMRHGPRRLRPIGRFGVAFLILAALIGPGVIVFAQAPPNTTIPRVPAPPLPPSDLANLPGDLRAVPVPSPSPNLNDPNLNEFVRDPAMARALGKALFWDMQVGSDRIQSCASCHFRAGADPRSKNQLSPGLKRMPVADLTYSSGRGPNFQLEAAIFPLTRLANSGVRGALDPRQWLATVEANLRSFSRCQAVSLRCGVLDSKSRPRRAYCFLPAAERREGQADPWEN